MPDLDLDLLNGPHANRYLSSVMLAPSAGAVRRRIFDRFVANEDYAAIRQFWPLIEDRHSPGFRDFFTEDAHKNLDQMMFNAASLTATADSIQSDYRRGLEDARFVGQVLLHCLERRVSQEEAFRHFRNMAGGQSRSTQFERWHRARRAAHFCAQWTRAPIPSPYGDNSMRRFRSWLAAAEKLRRQAERFIPKRRDGPLLDPTELWRIPKGLKRDH